MLSCVFAKAQTEGTYSGFSPYSVYGVGNLHTPGTAWNRGMGGVGIAARNHRFINIMNPASVTARDTLSFMADFGLNGRISLFSEGDKRALNTTFNIDDFVISFFTAGMDVQNISMYVYSMKRFNPSVNALSTVIVIVVTVILVLANLIPHLKDKRMKKEEQY